MLCVPRREQAEPGSSECLRRVTLSGRLGSVCGSAPGSHISPLVCRALPFVGE